MNIEQSDYGQGIGAAPEAYFARQSMERVRRGTAQSPVFATGKNGPVFVHEYWGNKDDLKNDKTVSLYNSKGIIQEDLTIELYAGYKYLWKETKNSVRRIKFIYEKISDTDSFFITEETAKKLKNLYNECYVCDEDFSRITAEEILQEPKEQKWDGEKDTIQAGKTLKYLNKQCKDDNQIIWECVKAEDGTEFWINQNDISETDSTPVKKIIYDKWDKFFTEINLKKYGKYYCEKKEDFLKDFDLQLGKATTVSNVMKNNKELLLSKYYKKESEWLDSDEHTNALIDKYPMNKNAIMQERTDYEFWSGLNNKIPRECYFFNPRAFICHLDKVATPLEFNPYEGMSFTYEWGYLNQNKKKENRTQIVESNPGFVPGKYSGDKFFPCTPNGLFRERYPSANTTSPYPHEGIDFDAAWGTDVFATIHGQVIYIGDQEDNHYGKHILIRSEDGFIFLLGHLSKVEVSLYQNVAPKTIVAKVGNSGNCWTGGHKVTPSEREAKLGAHLHLSVYKATKRIDIWSNKDSNYVKNQTLRNPFDRNHNFKTDGDL